MRLLVVEPDHLFRDNLVHHLRQRCFNVCIAEDRQELIQLLNEEQIDVALLGLDGLRREGLEMLRLILDVSPKTKVILMTNPDCLQYSIDGMKIGSFDDVLVPCDVDLLCSKIRQAIAHK
ncbi:Response regulator receiver domain-containing protein [Desulfonatronum thiosulfatophilum]|uniref:Response regulator receiver domain-containing protein n=1 Tax=Desulfonatronum thiosulfatophilum TaxID=617002 RepID=A0A1G6D644_9BACT|nr:response regulator [Desulfonatronum thiosulfatophilum]SDB40654.1 Response regulator receiver domain-containing protein [Desulfonatronum thiosulfatophilum]